jgi:hypothetical protein
MYLMKVPDEPEVPEEPLEPEVPEEPDVPEVAAASFVPTLPLPSTTKTVLSDIAGKLVNCNVEPVTLVVTVKEPVI